MTDHPREACGVVAVSVVAGAEEGLPERIVAAMLAQQHRGQESAGVVVSDGRRADRLVGMGLVADAIDPVAAAALRGRLGVGHTRYSTTGASDLAHAQPYLAFTAEGPLAVAHNGTLTNHVALRARLLGDGVALASDSDSELISAVLARPHGASWGERLAALPTHLSGAWSLAVLAGDAVYGARDPHGFRPLCLGVIARGGRVVGHAVASESVGLAAVGARFVREVDPGEVVRLDGADVQAIRGPEAPRAACLFEQVYFARPDSWLDGRTVSATRERAGEILAFEAPAEVDVVVDVPDSGRPAATGFARALGVPLGPGLFRNRYVGRTFIEPDGDRRAARVREKFSAVPDVVAGRRVALVDDSVVRGTTMPPLVRALRDAGAVAVHVRVASPPVRHPCYMGVDLSRRDELIAHRLGDDALADAFGADSVRFLSLDGLRRATPRPDGHCDGCFTGRYPIPTPTSEGA